LSGLRATHVASGKHRSAPEEDEQKCKAGTDPSVVPVEGFEFGARGGVRAAEAARDERGCRAPRLRADELDLVARSSAWLRADDLDLVSPRERIVVWHRARHAVVCGHVGRARPAVRDGLHVLAGSVELTLMPSSTFAWATGAT